MRKTLVSIITVIIASLTLLAQGDGSVQTRKDSLRSVLSSLSEWNDRRPAYQQLSLIYFIEAKDDSTIDSLLAVYDEMEAEAKKNDDTNTQCRIKHANKLLQQNNPELTIEFIAKQSGFGSRNAFYENYRSAYGLTPTEFRKAAKMQTFSISR